MAGLALRFVLCIAVLCGNTRPACADSETSVVDRIMKNVREGKHGYSYYDRVEHLDDKSTIALERALFAFIGEKSGEANFNEAPLKTAFEILLEASAYRNAYHRKEKRTAEENEIFARDLREKWLPGLPLAVQWLAISYLGRLPVKASIPALEKIAKDGPDPITKTRARSALVELEPSKPERVRELVDQAERLPYEVEYRRDVAEQLAHDRTLPAQQFFAKQILNDPELSAVNNLLMYREHYMDPALIDACLQRVSKIKLEAHVKPPHEVQAFLSRIDEIAEKNWIDKDEGEYLRVIKPFLTSPNSYAAYIAQTVLEKLTEKQGSYAQQSAFIREHAPLPKVEGNTCQTLCSIADRVTDWLRPQFMEKADFDEKGENGTWGFAVKSLAVLFLSKAAHYCPKARDFHDKVISRWVSPETLASIEDKPVSPQAAAEEKAFVEKLMAELDPESRSHMEKALGTLGSSVEGTKPLRASAVYGAAFYSLWLQELQATRELSSEMKTVVGNARRSTDQLLTQMNRHFEAARNEPEDRTAFFYSGSNSLYNTYAIATSLSALENPRIGQLGDLKKAIPSPEAPLDVTYAPVFKGGDERRSNERGAVARAPTVYLLLYRAEQDPQKKEEYRKILLTALENFADFSDVLQLQTRRDGTHLKPSGLAPYYFSGNFPYISSAWRILSEENRPDGEEQRILKKVAERLNDAALRTVGKDGLAVPHGVVHYASSPAYVNPLMGLALVSLAVDCPPLKPGRRPQGIVEDRLKVDPASDTLAYASDHKALVAATLGTGALLAVLARKPLRRAWNALACGFSKLVGRSPRSDTSIGATPPRVRDPGDI